MNSITNIQTIKTPLLFIIFNRLDTSKKVFEEIKKWKPPRLYISSDGPREQYKDEIEHVLKVREYIVQSINWDCELYTQFLDKNLGPGTAVSKAITWFFAKEEMGIILEHDCLPSQSFFVFCDQLLQKYKDDTRIMQISGFNFYSFDIANNYIVSEFGYSWGFATWKRAWQKYDHKIQLWPKFKEMGLTNDPPFYKERNIILDKTFNKLIDTWDYQWHFAIVSNHGLSLVPTKSLIQNIGFDEIATNTKDSDNIFAKVRANEINIPLKHYDYIFPNRTYDKNLFKLYHSQFKLHKRILKFILKLYIKLKKNLKYDRIRKIRF